MSWTRTLLALTFGTLAIVAIRAADEPLPNTGMADPAALVSTFDRFAADRTDPNVLILTLSNLRGLSSEPRNAGGSVRIDLATGDITEPSIQLARGRLLAARLAFASAHQQQVPRALANVLAAAVRHLRAARSSLADPTTLTPSFRN